VEYDEKLCHLHYVPNTKFLSEDSKNFKQIITRRLPTEGKEKLQVVGVPDMETGCCLGSEGNRISMGVGGEGRSGPPEKGKDKQSMPSKDGHKMEKDVEEQSNWA
jgi:hypothetical protein